MRGGEWRGLEQSMLYICFTKLLRCDGRCLWLANVSMIERTRGVSYQNGRNRGWLRFHSDTADRAGRHTRVGADNMLCLITIQSSGR